MKEKQSSETVKGIERARAKNILEESENNEGRTVEKTDMDVGHPKGASPATCCVKT